MAKYSLVFILIIAVVSIATAQSRKIYRGLEEALKEPSKVRVLKLKQTASLTEQLLVFPNLKELDISGLALEKLPKFFAKLDKLEVLDLSSNPLGKIPPSVLELKELKELYLFDCGLLQLPEGLRSLENLRYLNLGKNKGMDELLVAVNKEHLLLPKSLKILSIRYAKMKRLDPLILELEALDSLDLSFNDLQELPINIGRMPSLSYFNLAFNQIEQLPHTLSHSKTLKELDLRYNQLAYRPMTLLAIRELKLNINGNPFTQERIEKQLILQSSIREITDPRDQQKYSTIQLGTSYWMTKDLNWATDSSIGIETKAIHLYQAKAQQDQNLCPEGWHQANLEDWNKLNILTLEEFPIDPDRSSNLASIEAGRWIYVATEDPTVWYDPSYVMDFYSPNYYMLPSLRYARKRSNFFKLNLSSLGLFSLKSQSFIEALPTPYLIPKASKELAIVKIAPFKTISSIKNLDDRLLNSTYTVLRCVSDKSYSELNYSSEVDIKAYIFPEIEASIERTYYDSMGNENLVYQLKKEGEDYWVSIFRGGDEPSKYTTRYSFSETDCWISAELKYAFKKRRKRKKQAWKISIKDTIYYEKGQCFSTRLRVEKGMLYEQSKSSQADSGRLLYSSCFYLDERGYLVEEQKLGGENGRGTIRYFFKKGVGLVEIEYPNQEKIKLLKVM